MNFTKAELYYLEIALNCALEKRYSWESCGYVPEAMEDRKRLIELLDKVSNQFNLKSEK
jgi:hypothetical protein